MNSDSLAQEVERRRRPRYSKHRRASLRHPQRSGLAPHSAESEAVMLDRVQPRGPSVFARSASFRYELSSCGSKVLNASTLQCFHGGPPRLTYPIYSAKSSKRACRVSRHANLEHLTPRAILCAPPRGRSCGVCKVLACVPRSGCTRSECTHRRHIGSFHSAHPSKECRSSSET